jgi:hypothetical protein
VIYRGAGKFRSPFQNPARGGQNEGFFRPKRLSIRLKSPL